MMPAQANVIVGMEAMRLQMYILLVLRLGTVPHQQAVEVLPLLVMA